MSGISIRVQKAERLASMLEKVGTDVERKAITAVYASAFRIQADARRNAPVDTGRLRSSIFVRHLQGGMAAEVGTDVHYAPYQEYGTSRGVPPLFFLNFAYDAEAPKFVARMKSILGEARR